MATPMGELLQQAGLIDDMQLNAALAHQRQWGGRIGDILVDKGFIDEITMFQAIAHQSGTTLVSIPQLGVSPELVHAFPLSLAERHMVFPLKLQQKTLILALDNPKNVAAIDEVQFQMRMKVHPVVAPSREIEWAIRRWYHGEDAPCPEPKKRVVVSDEFKLTDASGATINKSLDDIRREAAARGDPRAAAALAAAPPAASAAPAFSPAHPPADPFGGAQYPMPSAVPQYVTHDQFHVLQGSIEGIQQVLRFMLDMSIQRGVFTREEYLAYVEQLRRGGG